MQRLTTFFNPGLLGCAMLACLPALPIVAASAQQCPISYGSADAAKPNKLYLYFPTMADSTFPDFGDAQNVTNPVQPFDIADLLDYPHNTSTTVELRDAIFNVVVETFCEFDVQVIQTTTPPPTTVARRNIIAIGTDEANDWGRSEEADIGDAHAVNKARVWAGTYNHSDALSGAGSTVERWALSIGGTCAHEAGHGYGLDHLDGLVPTPGEDPLEHHLMAEGTYYVMEARAGYRRHFSDHEYSILAANVGLSIQTMWNWDLVNPNAETASKLRMDFLSTQPSLILSWSYSGRRSPWINPTVTGPSGTTTFKGTTYNRYQIEWATGKPWDNGPAGQVPGGMGFHVGATFSSVNFSDPDPIIIRNVVLSDENGDELALHPRFLGFDSGTLDAQDGVLNLRFFNTQQQPLSLRDLVVQQLPRVLSLDEMIPGGKMRDPHNIPFSAWPGGIQRLKESPTIPPNEGEYKVALAHVGDKRHIYEVITGKSSAKDSLKEPDVAKFGSGVSVDLFPATTVYVTGTIVDPEAKYWDPKKKSYVTGPLESRFYYQMAGRHPDLNKNGIDDYVEIATGKAKATRVRGVPDDVETKK